MGLLCMWMCASCLYMGFRGLFSLALFPFSFIFDDYFFMRERARKSMDLDGWEVREDMEGGRGGEP